MTLYILVGQPGSGKTYFAKRHLMQGPGWLYISRDEIRTKILKDKEEYFSHETEVFNNFVKQIKHGLESEGIFNIIADATHLNWTSRRKLINALGNINCDIIPVVINCSIEKSISNNEKRSGREHVPIKALQQMKENMTDPKGDPYYYTAIMYVDNNKEDKI